MDWEPLYIRTPPLMIRPHHRSFELKDYDLEIDEVVSALTGETNRIVHFFAVFRDLLKTHSYEELFAPVRNTSINIKTNFLPRKIDKMTSPLLLAMSAFRNLPARNHAAQNPFTHALTLGLLSHDPDLKVRRSVALNPNLSLKDILALSHDPDFGVVGMIASNPSTPLTLLEKLSSECDYYLSNFLTVNPNLPKELLEDIFVRYPNPLILSQIASHPNTDEDLLVGVATHYAFCNPDIAMNNPICPLSLFSNLVSRCSIDHLISVANSAANLSYEKQEVLVLANRREVINVLYENTSLDSIKEILSLNPLLLPPRKKALSHA